MPNSQFSQQRAVAPYPASSNLKKVRQTAITICSGLSHLTGIYHGGLKGRETLLGHNTLFIFEEYERVKSAWQVKSMRNITYHWFILLPAVGISYTIVNRLYYRNLHILHRQKFPFLLYRIVSWLLFLRNVSKTYTHRHGTNNYKDTKPWMSSLLVFNTVYRLETQSVMLVFSTPLVN
jgi:hypothetical protein